MQRTENKRNLRAIIAHRVLAGLDNRIQPAVEFRILVAAGQEALQIHLGAVSLAAGHIPESGQLRDAADAINLLDGLAHALAVLLIGKTAHHRRLHHAQTNDGRIMPGERMHIRMMPLAVLRRKRHIQPALLAKENALVALQIVQELGGRICLRQCAVIEADGIGRLAAFRYLLGTGEGNARFIRLRRLRRLRRGIVANAVGLRAGRGFVVFRVVVVGRLHRNFRALLCGGEGEGAVGGAVNRLTVGKPLVFDACCWYAVIVGYGRFQLTADFSVAADAHFACVIGLRLRVR